MKNAHRQAASIVALIAMLCSLFSTASRSMASSAILAPATDPAQPSALPGPASITLAGNLQQELGCASDWDPACATTHLTSVGNGVWRGVFSVPAGSWEYKMVRDDAWANGDYAGNHQANGNTTLNITGATTQTVRFYYDDKTHAVLDSVMDRNVVAVGSFQNEVGCQTTPISGDGDWAPDCLQTLMTDVDGDGTYTLKATGIPAGSYELKVALNENWTENYGGPGGANLAFTVASITDIVTFSFVSSTNTPTVTVQSGTASNDNNVEFDGLLHNSQSDVFRTPFGAVNPGTKVTLRFRTFHNDVTGVVARLYDTRLSGGTQLLLNMQPAATDVSCVGGGNIPAGKTCDMWQTSYTPTVKTTVYYRFIVNDGTSTAYYSDDRFWDGGDGLATAAVVANTDYVITVFDPAFQPISWMKDAVMYQIFPDRFRNGDTTNDAHNGDVRYDSETVATSAVEKRSWGQLPEGFCQKYVGAATACAENPRGRDYFGGDLKGVEQKLGYLQQLGINTIYFNPIFDAGSNHAYDTQDYKKIDPYFGTQADWDSLVAAANSRNMRIILDGVFNHLSSDSEYFDRYHHYPTVGACESPSSPYRSWFFFRDLAGGPCAGPNGPNTMTYDGWFGFDSIPVMDKNNQQVRDFVYAGTGTGAAAPIAPYWLNQGAAGWRLDVMSDGSFPAEYWEQFRQVVKTAKPDAPIIGETWKKDEILPGFMATRKMRRWATASATP